MVWLEESPDGRIRTYSAGASIEAPARHSGDVLACAKQTIASVAEPWQDVALLVEFAIKGRAVDDDIRMRPREAADTFGSSDQAQKTDSCRAGTFQRGNGCRSASTGGEHRIEQKEIALGGVPWNLEVIVDRFERIMIAIQTDVSDSRCRDEPSHTFDHAKPCP